VTATIRTVDDRGELLDFFADDRRAHLYALADLDDPFWSESTWWRRGDAVVGLIGLPENGGNAVYAVATRDVPGTLELLGELAHRYPPGTLVTGPVGCGQALAAAHQIAWSRTYHRYHHRRPDRLVPRRWSPEPLARHHVDQLAELYASDPGAAFFLPSMLDTDAFVGVRHDGRLIAAAGAHVVSERQRVAAIGGVVTHPQHRRQGLGHDATVGVVRRLAGRVDDIGLNCADANTGARQLYLEMGFDQHIPYEECGLAPARSTD